MNCANFSLNVCISLSAGSSQSAIINKFKHRADVHFDGWPNSSKFQLFVNWFWCCTHSNMYKTTSLGKWWAWSQEWCFLVNWLKKKKMQKRWFNAFKSCLESHKAGHTVFLIVQQVMYPEFDQCQWQWRNVQLQWIQF